MNEQKLNTIILAGGFGTRLGIDSLPKALIETNDSTLLDRLMARLPIDEVVAPLVLVTNDKFVMQFEIWRQRQNWEINIVNNGVQTPEARLGAIGDMLLASHQVDQTLPTLVCASDTFFNFDIGELITLYEKYGQFTTAVYPVGKEQIKSRLGCVELDGERVTGFEEKPDEPKSEFASVPFYVFPPGITDLLGQYKQTGRSMDAPGNIIPWLLENQKPVYALVTDEVVDVGTKEDIEKLNR